MSQGSGALPEPTGVAAEAFEDLLGKGRAVGALPIEDVVAVLEEVELTRDVIDSVKLRLAAEGIVIEDPVEEDPIEETTSPWSQWWRYRHPTVPRTAPRRRRPIAPPAPDVAPHDGPGPRRPSARRPYVAAVRRLPARAGRRIRSARTSRRSAR